MGVGPFMEGIMDRETQHTPGPWHTEVEYVSAQRKARTGYTLVRGHGDVFVTKVFGEDDARLIAAAPDLLFTLRHLLAIVTDGYTPGSGDIRACQEAIVRAEGRP